MWFLSRMVSVLAAEGVAGPDSVKAVALCIHELTAHSTVLTISFQWGGKEMETNSVSPAFYTTIQYTFTHMTKRKHVCQNKTLVTAQTYSDILYVSTSIYLPISPSLPPSLFSSLSPRPFTLKKQPSKGWQPTV